MRHTEFLRELRLAFVDVDADNHVGAHQARTLNDIQANSTEPENHDVCSGGDLCGVDDRADARGHPAADVADLFERRIFTNLRQSDLRNDGVIGESRRSHVVKQLLAAGAKAAAAVRHHAASLGLAHGLTEVGLAAETVLALPALGHVERNDVIARRETTHACSDFHHDTCAFVSENRGKQTLGIRARERKRIRVAYSGCLDLDQNLPLSRPLELDGLDTQGLAGFVCHGGARLHGHELPLLAKMATFRRHGIAVGDGNTKVTGYVVLAAEQRQRRL